MNRRNKFERLDWIVAGIFFAACFALRVPFRSQLAYHWDSAEFSLAVREYNVALSQPHPPGYFLYVMLGRLMNYFVDDPHASLVWLSVVFGSALTAVLYLLGMAMFGRRTGLVAALLAISSPQYWFHSCVALTYVVDSFFVCLVVLWCWNAMNRGGRWSDAVIIGGLLAVIGGIRQQTVPGLLPLVLFTFWKFRSQRVKKLAVAACVSLVGAAAWFVPMAKLSGGMVQYLEVVSRFSAFVAQKTAIGGGWDALFWNMFFAVAFCWNGLLVGALLIPVGLLYRMYKIDEDRRRDWDAENALGLRVLALWIAPMLLLGIAVSFTDGPGHIFSYLPGFFLLVALVVAQVHRKPLFVATVATICLVNSAVFLGWPPQCLKKIFIGGELTAGEIRMHDQQLGQTVNLIRAQYNPSETIVCHAREYFLFGMRHFQLYLPEFEQYQIVPDRAMVTPQEKPMLTVHNGRLEFAARMDLAGKRVVLFVVPPGQDINRFAKAFDLSRVKPINGSDGMLYSLELDPRTSPTAKSSSS